MSIGESWVSFPAHTPPLAVNYKNNVVYLYYGVYGTNRVIASAPISKGAYYTIVMHTLWSKGQDGFVESWLNNVPFTAYNGTDYRYYGRNMYNAAPLYLKLGLYRNKEVTATGTVYFDDLRRGGTQTELQ